MSRINRNKRTPRKGRFRAVAKGASVGATVAAAVPLPGARFAGAVVGGLVGWLASTPAERGARKVARGIPSPLLLSEDDVQQAVETLREAKASGLPFSEALKAPPVARLLLVPRVSPQPPELGAFVVGLRAALHRARVTGGWSS